MYKDIPLKGFSAWFLTLSELAEKTDNSSSLPRLELLLKNGHSVRGALVKAQKIEHDLLLMIHEMPEASGQGDVIFLASSEVIGLRVLNFSRISSYFKQDLPPREIGSLELKRSSKAIEAQLEKYFTEKVQLQFTSETLTEKSRGEILTLLEILPAVFESLTADELGKRIVNEQIRQIEVNIAEKPETTLKDHKLTILTNHIRIQTPNEEKQRLRIEIENLL